jgi:hypothetical protein
MCSCCDENITLKHDWAWSQKEVGSMVFIMFDGVIIIRELAQLFLSYPQLLTCLSFAQSFTA